VRKFALLSVLTSILFVSRIGSQESPLSQAQELLKEGKPRDALPILLDLQRSEPANADLCQQIGIAYTQLQDFPQAEKFYREAIRLNPQFWAARNNLGTVLWFMDRHDESEREFLAVSRVRPNDPVPHLYLGLAAHARREFPHAKEEFKKAGELASNNPEVLPAVLESYLATGDLTFSSNAENLLASTESSDPTLASRVAALFLQYGFPDQAAAVLEKLTAAHTDSADGWRMLAQAYDLENKPEDAYRAYSRAIEAAPNLEDSYIALADFASAHGNNDYGLEVVTKGLQRLPNSPGLLCERGLVLALKGDRDQAEKSFVEASQRRPGWALPLLALGISQLESGNAPGAADTFQKSRSVDPKDFRTHYLYAFALTKKDGNGGKAIVALRKAIELNPEDARSHALLGQLLLAEQHPNEAASEWQRALKIEPANPTALYQLALLYKKQGKTQQADRLLEAFQRAKAKMRSDEQSLVEILRVVPEKRAP
jgi:tetratricopeptide (TPR) repeat protein